MKAVSVLVCPHCGNKTPHREVLRHSYVGDWYGPGGEASEHPPTSYHIGYVCATCHDISIYGSHEEADGEEWLEFPANVLLDAAIPEIVASNYRESDSKSS